MKYYIKLFHEILNDRKMVLLPDNLWRRCIELFVIAGETEEEGFLPSAEDIAFRLRQDPEQITAELEELQKTGIIQIRDERYFVTNFQKRQEPMSSTERTRKQRETDRKSGIIRDYWKKDLYENLPESPAVYMLICKGTEKRYIGATKNLKARIKMHLTEINSGLHPMTDDIKEFGKESFYVEICELVENTADLPERETAWIRKYDSDMLYNDPKTPGKRHREWDKNGDESSQKSPQIRLDKIRSDNIEIKESEDSELDPLVLSLEKNTGLMVMPNDWEMIDELKGLGVTEEDIKAALRWRIENNIPPVKSVRQLKDGIITSRNKRVQQNGAAGSQEKKKDYSVGLPDYGDWELETDPKEPETKDSIAWKAILGEMKYEMPAAAFMKIENCFLTAVEGGSAVISCNDQETLDFVSNRLDSTIRRKLVGLLNQPIESILYTITVGSENE